MVHLNRIGWRVSFLPLCDVSKKADHYVDSRHNTQAESVGLGQLLGVLLAILRSPGAARLAEVSLGPDSPALGMVLMHLVKTPHVLEAWGVGLIPYRPLR